MEEQYDFSEAANEYARWKDFVPSRWRMFFLQYLRDITIIMDNFELTLKDFEIIDVKEKYGELGVYYFVGETEKINEFALEDLYLALENRSLLLEKETREK